MKEKFRNIVIVGHPSTLQYCMKVFGSEYRERVTWISKIDYEIIKNAAIIADCHNKACDLFIDFDYYSLEKQRVAEIFPYYQSPTKFYFESNKECKMVVNRIPRKTTVCVCGTVPANGYKLLKENFPKSMNRSLIVDAIIEDFAGKICELLELQNRDDCDILMAVRDERMGKTEYLLNSQEFMKQLEMSQFYIAAPGNGMPHCHNMIEALAEGTIPITNYAGYMYPPLIDGENCLTIHDRESLKQAIRRALAMSDEEISFMKNNVKKYFLDNCSRESVLNQLERYFYRRQKKMLLVNDEGNTIRLKIEKNQSMNS